jgi:hypothetical protein
VYHKCHLSDIDRVDGDDYGGGADDAIHDDYFMQCFFSLSENAATLEGKERCWFLHVCLWPYAAVQVRFSVQTFCAFMCACLFVY